MDGLPYENFPIRHRLKGAAREVISSASKKTVGFLLKTEGGFTAAVTTGLLAWVNNSAKDS